MKSVFLVYLILLAMIGYSGAAASQSRPKPISLDDLPDDVILGCLRDHDETGVLDEKVKIDFIRDVRESFKLSVSSSDDFFEDSPSSILPSFPSIQWPNKRLIFLISNKYRSVNLCMIDKFNNRISLVASPSPPEKDSQQIGFHAPRPDQTIWIDGNGSDYDSKRLLIGMDGERCPNPCHRITNYVLYSINFFSNTINLLDMTEAQPEGHSFTPEGRLYFIADSHYADPCGEEAFITLSSYSILQDDKFHHVPAKELGFKDEKIPNVADCNPPDEPGTFLKSDLVELITFDPNFKFDIRYATNSNFLGRAVYQAARAFLQRPTAEALARVNQGLKKEGLGLMIFDGYRPWSVTQIFWDETPADKHAFVADPAKGSRHNRGCAVDLTLYDLQTGKPLQMPSDYDEMNEKAHPGYAGGDPVAHANRDRLRQAMEAEGFSVYENEWWHFDFKDWRQYALLNLSFAEIDAGLQPAGIR